MGNMALWISAAILTFHRLDMKNPFMGCNSKRKKERKKDPRAPAFLIHLGLSSQSREESLMALQGEVGSPNRGSDSYLN